MIYDFSEDSKLLLDSTELVLSQDKSIKDILEMGCGPGEVLLRLHQKFPDKNFTGADKNEEALKIAKDNFTKNKANIKLIHSDLFSNISEKYDLIIFNPPYLPNDEEFQDISLHGGKKGNEISIKFLREALDYLKSHGKIILLMSSLSHPEEIEQEIKNLKLKFSKIKQKKLFFEEISCYLIERDK